VTDSAFLKIAFVGCGGIAQAHWQGIQTHVPRMKVTAAVDIDPAQAAAMAERTGGKAFTSLEAALAEGDFDAVDIMLPHHLHEAAAMLAFEAGKHVMLEKPMATTLDACDRILTAAQKAGTVFMVAEQSQYWPHAVKTRQLIQNGAIGEIITARAAFGGKAHRGPGPKPWRYDKTMTGGGISIDGGLHWIRPLRMWLGDVDEAIGVLDYPDPEMEGESLALAIFRFKSGKVGVFEALRAGRVSAPREDFRVTGTQGVIVIKRGDTAHTRHDHRVLLHDEAHPEGHDMLTEAEGRESAFGLEIADFAQAILHGTALTAGPEESLADLRTVLAMYRSAESRQWEKV
jgi:UDP-N-acetyl-2-amino-2-deoxyglucuronate dehydrogenase